MSDSLIQFHLGPVQPFIAAARSLRDLWTGSYILSWMVAQALSKARTAHGKDFEVLSLAPDELPLVRWFEQGGRGKLTDRDLIPCLPNTFVARVPAEKSGAIARLLETESRAAWLEIAREVHTSLSKITPFKSTPGWDRLWADQIETFFEIRTAIAPCDQLDQNTLKSLGIEVSDGNLEGARVDYSARLMRAVRAIPHFPKAATGDVPGKCSLLGTLEQMGPPGLDASAAFWDAAAEVPADVYRGARIREGERFCAVSLVKRFAWAAYFHDKAGRAAPQSKFEDTATVAAADWLSDATINASELKSGQWLHWRKQDEGKDDGEGNPSPDLWEHIQAARKAHGAAPAYYALLMLDGDDMGDWMQGKVDAAKKTADISAALADFATNRVGETIGERNGELIYAGGDDVLAMLPARRAIDCAAALNREFSAAFSNHEEAHISAGIVIAHYHEDLRFVLERAREAEQKAKVAGKNRFCLTVLKHSGEHSSIVLPWSFADRFGGWVKWFKGDNGADEHSDRWVYHLRQELPTLGGMPIAAQQAELRRVFKRSEGAADDTQKRLEDDFNDFVQPGNTSKESGGFEDFIRMLQAASFLARGGRE